MENYKSYDEFISIVYVTKDIAEVQPALQRVIDEMAQKDPLREQTIHLLEKLEGRIRQETEEALSVRGIVNLNHALELVHSYKKALSRKTPQNVGA